MLTNLYSFEIVVKVEHLDKIGILSPVPEIISFKPMIVFRIKRLDPTAIPPHPHQPYIIGHREI